MVSVVETTNTPQSYSGAWREFRKLRKRTALLFLAFIFVPLCVAYVSLRVFDSAAPGLVLAAITMFAAVFSLWQFTNWPCPRCGENFGVMQPRCAYCGLVKGADSPDRP